MGRYGEARWAGLLRGAAWAQPRTGRIEGLTPVPRAFRLAEYKADIEITARRELRERPVDWAVFWYHCMHKLYWADCLRLIESQVGYRIGRGEYFHALYRVQETLGRAFVEMRPHALWPEEYFAGRTA
jgi:hypothetical protein